MAIVLISPSIFTVDIYSLSSRKQCHNGAQNEQSEVKFGHGKTSLSREGRRNGLDKINIYQQEGAYSWIFNNPPPGQRPFIITMICICGVEQAFSHLAFRLN
jgi:hypothetical protein